MKSSRTFKELSTIEMQSIQGGGPISAISDAIGSKVTEAVQTVKGYYDTGVKVSSQPTKIVENVVLGAYMQLNYGVR